MKLFFESFSSKSCELDLDFNLILAAFSKF